MSDSQFETAMFILHKLIEADNWVSGDELAENLTAPAGWLAFAWLAEQGSVTILGAQVRATEKGAEQIRIVDRLSRRARVTP